MSVWVLSGCFSKYCICSLELCYVLKTDGLGYGDASLGLNTTNSKLYLSTWNYSGLMNNQTQLFACSKVLRSCQLFRGFEILPQKQMFCVCLSKTSVCLCVCGSMLIVKQSQWQICSLPLKYFFVYGLALCGAIITEKAKNTAALLTYVNMD